MIDPSIPLIAIVGPTATGKTDLALDMAEQFGGEILCADSRTIYRGMDIGTAKPTSEEQARVPHHLLDIADPGEQVTASEFKRLAERTAVEIWDRGHVPFLVGGSGLYVDAILYDYQFPPMADPDRRKDLEALPLAELVEQLVSADPSAVETIDIANKRRVVRALETLNVGKSRRETVRPNTLVLGLSVNKEVAQERIEHRIEKMLAQGFIDEVRTIGETFGWDSEALTGIGYRAFKDVVLGTKPLDVGKAEFIRGDMSLRRRQLTWFRRNKEIHWITPEEAPKLIVNFLGQV